MPANRRISGTEMPAWSGVQGPGEMTIFSGLPRGDLVQRERVVAVDVHVRAQLAQVLDEVVGEAVVVVDHQQHVQSSASSPCCTMSAARSTARALFCVSVHSDAGTESWTMPAPACT